MTYALETERRLKEILKHAGSALLKDFTRQFYAQVPLRDLEAADPAIAAKIAAQAWNFFKSHKPGSHRIRMLQQPRGVNSHEARSAIEITNDDMPFLLDSITAELLRRKLPIYAVFHPIIPVQGKKSQSLIHIEVPLLSDKDAIKELESALDQVLKAVRHAVTDWRKIVARCDEVRASLDKTPKGIDSGEMKEARDFLQWLRESHFIFLGYVEYDFFDSKGREQLQAVKGSELGIFKLADFAPTSQGLAALPKELQHFARVPRLIEITKANRRSIVHRPAHMDYVGVKRFDSKGQVIGEARFLGLFTSAVYFHAVEEIPIVRRKIHQILNKAGFAADSHDGKALRTILEFYPRDELFQIDAEPLFEASLGILSLEMQPRVGLFVRKDAFERFLSCLVYLPRERLSTELREAIQQILEKASGGQLAAHYTQVTESPLARLHIIIKTEPGQIRSFDVKELEAEIARITDVWQDRLYGAITVRFGESKAERLFRRYAHAFSTAYTFAFNEEKAVQDIEEIETLEQGSIFRLSGTEDAPRLRMYSIGDPMPLSDMLPVIENLGFRVIDETPYKIDAEGKSAWLRDLELKPVGKLAAGVGTLRPLLEEALSQVFGGRTENDGLNRLVLLSGLGAREVSVLRGYTRYLQQARFDYGQDAIEKAFAAYPHMASALIELFHARFDPSDKKRDAKIKGAEVKIATLLEGISSITPDRIFRRFEALIGATLRTNYYQKDSKGKPKSWISFKLNSQAIPDLPLPRPWVEIFVYSTRIEGVHLRGGKVARGGLRWSDRREDFRTEVLGLMKAQMVKNAVIVPVGSKGGFYVKQPPQEGGRDAFMTEGIACYQTFLRGLLDLTDNIAGNKIIPPKDVVRYDEDDPYLVVAADKGTASFSDIANGVSAEYGFWLGDAFASGGSKGYDHKEMGITAKGGWISVKRHFREMGVNIEKEAFTAVGIGDMAGDVFGNGMLLSDRMKLLAAFNHLHIFLDPDPDPKASFAERMRLFELPRSSWTDYDKKRISKGGGVFERSAKSIPLSTEIRKALGISASALAPDALIQAILKAPVDLLWNGGIGTYVKAEDETHEEVGDRANNALRVNGRELGCKLVGEGGNLGFTQKGRIEYALKGGRINTDAIDNSAGVDCSDHEVNIKIAFADALAKKELTLPKRDTLLVKMTDEVARLVLRDNHLQTQALSIAQAEGMRLLEAQQRLMQRLESQKLLSRAVEYLPNDEELAERKAEKKPLTRPEIAVLLAYSKIALYQELLSSDLPDDPYCAADLQRYFPPMLVKDFSRAIKQHRLRREIIATVVTNSIVNRVGSTFFATIAEETGLPSSVIAKAYMVVRDSFHLRALWAAIESHDGKVPTSVQMEMFLAINRFAETVVHWMLREYGLKLKLSELTDSFGKASLKLQEKLNEVLTEPLALDLAAQASAYEEKGVAKDLARKIASLTPLASVGDIVTIAGKIGKSVDIAGRAYFELGALLSLDWLKTGLEQLSQGTYWDKLASSALAEQLSQEQRRLALEMLGKAKGSVESVFDSWRKANEQQLARYTQFAQDLKRSEDRSHAALTVALRRLGAIS